MATPKILLPLSDDRNPIHRAEVDDIIAIFDDCIGLSIDEEEQMQTLAALAAAMCDVKDQLVPRSRK